MASLITRTHAYTAAVCMAVRSFTDTPVADFPVKNGLLVDKLFVGAARLNLSKSPMISPV